MRWAPGKNLNKIGLFAVSAALLLGFTYSLGAWMGGRVGHRIICYRTDAARAQIATLSTALDAFQADCGRYPTTVERFAPLLTRWARDTNWRGPYLAKAIEQYPWKKSIRYVAPGVHNPGGYDLSSAGPDGQFDTSDDLTNWNHSGIH